ncbi:MAG: ftsZ [Bacteroidetes bacterium]|nr:ftsZ [Bacteroidota bacterium]
MTEKKYFEPDYGTKANTSIIKVIGIGGGGGNAVKHMYKDGIQGVDFLICNTDRVALERNPIPEKLVLGESGLGAGANPEVARQLAEESRDQIIEFIGHDTKMLFLTAGMGKGTGTGATPIVAQIAKELGILTVAVVTEPFRFEGEITAKHAEDGIRELKKHVDSLIIVKNQNILKYYNDLDFDTAFGHADDVLKNAVKCIAELITINLDQNIDFNDIKSIMQNSGPAMLGLAEAEGENRVQKVVEGALSCPLLSEEHITNAKNFLFSLSYGPDDKFTINEFDELTQLLSSLRSNNARVIWGRTEDKSLNNRIKLAVIVTNYAVDEVMITDMGNGQVTILNDDTISQVPLVPENKSDMDFESELRDNSYFSQKYGNSKVIDITDLNDINSPFTQSQGTIQESNKQYGSSEKSKFDNPLDDIFLNQNSLRNSDSNNIQNTYTPTPNIERPIEQPKMVQESVQQPKPYTPNIQGATVNIPKSATKTADLTRPEKVVTHVDPRFENDSAFNELYNTPAMHRQREETMTISMEKQNPIDSMFGVDDDMHKFFKSVPD